LNWISIALGGAVGALLRYLVSGWAYALLGEGFPWGTLSVNLLGSFLIGFLWRLFDQIAIAPNTRTLIFVGGLGAFTTFSTFGLESFNLLRGGQVKLGLLNMLSSNVLGILFIFLGFVAARAVLAAGR
jgi:CrcB protein